MPDQLTRTVEIKEGTEIRIRGLRWDDGWEFDCPVVILDPILRVYEDGRDFESAVEDLCIDGCIDGKLIEHESSSWRWKEAPGGAMAYLRRKYYRKNVERLDTVVRFVLDEYGELSFEELKNA